MKTKVLIFLSLCCMSGLFAQTSNYYTFTSTGCDNLYIQHASNRLLFSSGDAVGETPLMSLSYAGSLNLANPNGNGIGFMRTTTYPSMTFMPNNGNSIFHISHTLNNSLEVSQGTNPGTTPIMTLTNYGSLDVKGSTDNITILNKTSTYPSISFVPNDGDAIFHIYHTLNNSLQISQGTNPATSPLVTLAHGGNLGIGVTAPEYKLDVAGTIRAQEIIVNLDNAADYVFEESYDLKPIGEVYDYVKENKHLPGVPTAAEMKDGVSVSELSNKLLEKVEELTLYMAEQDRTIKAQQARIEELENVIK